MAKLLTSLCFILFAIVGYKVAMDLKSNSSDNEQVLILSLVIVSIIGVPLFCFLFRTTGYKIENGNLIILRPARDLQLPLSEIEKVEKIDKIGLRGTIRTFGVGGLFGYFGKFYNPRIGKMTFYASRRDVGILLKMKNEKLIYISPDEREEFIKDLESMRKVS